MPHIDENAPVRSASPLHALVCAPIVALGLLDTVGWLLHSVHMVTFGTGRVAMSFNAGLCFILCGVALGLAGHTGGGPRRLCTALAAATLLLCSATLLEISRNESLGVDLAFLQTWYYQGNASPGRMAPNSAIGFILVSLASLLSARITSKARAIGAVVLTFAVLAVGLTGLIAYTLAPDLIFEWARSARMAISTSAGMILCSLALRGTWSATGWYQSRQFIVEDEKIRLLAAATVMVAAIVSGLSGFVFLQHEFRKALVNKFEQIVEDRRSLFFDTLRHDVETAADVANRNTAGIETALAAGTVSAVQFKDDAGRVVRVMGHPSISPSIPVPMEGAQRVELLWDGVDRVTLPNVHDGRRNGSVIIDQSAASLEKALVDSKQLGPRGEIALCVPQQAVLSCFRGTRQATPFTLTAPIGEVTLDSGGRNVMAHRGVLAPGIIIVVEEGAAEAFGVVREALRFGAPMLLLISALGGTLLLFQLRPLTGRLVASEARAREKELQMRSILESVGEGILTFDAHGLIQDVNAAACEIFGYDPAEMIGRSTDMLMPDGDNTATEARLERNSRSALALLAGNRNVKLSGQRKGGAEFPVEMTITETASSNHTWFVAVIRDITERTETERKLTQLSQYDSLTALPNRSLFLERLSAAALRLQQNGAAFALMFIDVDGFKEVNDRLGHRAGDDLLIQIAARLCGAVRNSDTVARLAGDEFTVIVETLSSPTPDSRHVADKIISTMQRPFVLFGREVTVSVSLGLVVQETAGFTTTDLLARADRAMYRAKHAGKNRVIAA